MEAMDASGSRLCQIIQGAGLRPRTAQHFQTVLATAGIVALTDTGFASRMDDMMVNSIRKFTAVKKRADDLAVLLQPARPGSSLPATLIGLHGDELFQALVALQVPGPRRRMCTLRPCSPHIASPCKKPSTCTSTSTRKSST